MCGKQASYAMGMPAISTCAPIDSGMLKTLLGPAVAEADGALDAALVLLGDALGLYATLGELGPLTAIELAAHTETAEPDVRGWLAAQVAPMRIRVSTRAYGDAEFDRVLGSGDFDGAIDTWRYSIASQLELYRAFTTESPLNRGDWTDVAYDALVGQLLVERKADEAARLADQIGQALEAREAAVIPLGYPTLPFLLGKRVVSFAMTPFGDPDLVRIELVKR